MSSIIKVGFCVAYDWPLLKRSVPRVYDYADIICFSIDQHRRTWSGLPYTFDDDAFFSWVKEIDCSNKIKILDGDFSDNRLSPIENDNKQRQSMASFMGKGGWHIQIDADEYFIDFKSFAEYLKKMDPNPSGESRPINIYCNLIPIIKQTVDGFLYARNLTNPQESAPFATNVPAYLSARRNGHFNHFTNYNVIHETWARSENELLQKLNNWGHRDDFDKTSYFNLWKAIDSYNYRYIRNFHPLAPVIWEALCFQKASNMQEFLDSFDNAREYTPITLAFKNSRVIQGLKSKLKI